MHICISAQFSFHGPAFSRCVQADVRTVLQHTVLILTVWSVTVVHNAAAYSDQDEVGTILTF